MARRRGGTVTARCTHPGCAETGSYSYENRADYARIERDYVQNWKCVRHTKPDEVLSESNHERTRRLVATHGEGLIADRLYWVDPEGPPGCGSGFSHGPGFKAYAKDFPPGTVLEITARVILPDDRRTSATGGGGT